MKARILVVIIILIVLVLGGIAVYVMQPQTAVDSPSGNGGSTNKQPDDSTNEQSNGSVNGQTPETNSGTAVKPETYNIAIKSSAFSPKTLEIKAGDSVVWQNQDFTAHTVTSNSGNELGSTNLAQGQSYSHQFDTPGIYTYHCRIHSSMQGTITVAPNPDYTPS